MPEFYNDQIKLNKLHTLPKKGFKLGTAGATWKKIKSVTSSNSRIGTSVDGGIYDDDTGSGEQLVENGKNGEIVIVYPETETLELWDWTPPSKSQKEESETLYLQSSVMILKGKYESFLDANALREASSPSRVIQSFVVLEGTPSILLKLLVVTRVKDETFIEVHVIKRNESESHLLQLIKLPSVLQTKEKKENKISENCTFTVKVGGKFVVASNDDGYMYVMKIGDNGTIRAANFDFNLQSIRKSVCQPIINNNFTSKDFSEEELIIKTSIFDKEPVFDIIGNWLVYSPVKAEYTYIRNTCVPFKDDVEMTHPIITNLPNESDMKRKSIFTPVKLPPPGPILNRVISTLSNTALDGLFKISVLSSKKVRSYLMKNNSKKTVEAKELEDEMNHSLNSIGKTISKILYSTASSTASTVQNSTRILAPNNNQLIRMIDLSNDKVLLTFKPPGGVSRVSLSPYDLQLVHSSFRGDLLYMWDLYKLPKETALLGKFERGRTSATIKDIFWFVNSFDSEIKGNNYGFGCTTKPKGSVHWFNVNYLSGNSTDNYPNVLGSEKSEEATKEHKFLDSWILSSMNAKRFLKLPNISNSNVMNSKSKNLNQLGILDESNRLKLISTLNGHTQFEYEIPVMQVSEDVEVVNDRIDDCNFPQKCHSYYLAHAEIETCGPYINLINNKNITFATYDFKNNDSDSNNLLKCFTSFGDDIPHKKITFKRKGSDSSMNTSEDLLLYEFNKRVLIENDDHSHQTNDFDLA